MTTNIDTNRLVRRATALANIGRWEEAEQAWEEVRQREPQHPKALFSLGVHALRRGDSRAALTLLSEAHVIAPSDLQVLIALAKARRAANDWIGERQAIEAALLVDPYFIPALLARGEWLERHVRLTDAANTYRNCLRISPPESNWPASLRERLRHARRFADWHAKALERHLLEQLGAKLSNLPGPLRERWREAIGIRAGRSRMFNSFANQLQVPRLPAIPFFERERLPWVPALEASSSAIAAELHRALGEARAGFRPYVTLEAGQPVDQWAELNHSDRWSALHLWHAGEPQRDALVRCPETAAALERVPTATIGGLCPNAMFSLLAPRTRIPPHHGETNARLVAHLPLVVPGGCWFRVGGEHRRWEEGKVLVFDDTIEHEAANDGDEPRVVLIFDIWNPLLTDAECQLAAHLAMATREFGGPAKSSAGARF